MKRLFSESIEIGLNQLCVYILTCVIYIYAATKQGLVDETCIGLCEEQYGNRDCDERCITQHYPGGLCEKVGEATPQCCCFKF